MILGGLYLTYGLATGRITIPTGLPKQDLLQEVQTKIKDMEKNGQATYQLVPGIGGPKPTEIIASGGVDGNDKATKEASGSIGKEEGQSSTDKIVGTSIPQKDPWSNLGLTISPPVEGYSNVKIKVTHYWPPWGGTNCFSFISGDCVSSTSSGLPWQDYRYIGAACPYAWTLGTIVGFDKGKYGVVWFVCVDRGIMYCDSNDLCQVDIMTDTNVDGTYNGKVKLIDGVVY